MTRRDSPEGRAGDVNKTIALATVYASVALWLAVMAGNAALYTVRPAGHWPALETIEALEAASFIPVALILYRISRHSRPSLVVAVVGVCALAVNVLLDVAFASGLLVWGKGLFTIVTYDIAGVAVLGWLFSGNVLARRAPPRSSSTDWYRSGRPKDESSLPGLMASNRRRTASSGSAWHSAYRSA